MKKQKGFTLIELMVVIVILGILAAVIAPRIPQFVNKAKEGRTKGNLATLRSTLNIYYSDNDGRYPVAADNAAFQSCLVPKYLKSLPECETVNTGHGKNNDIGDFDGIVGDDDLGKWGYSPTETSANWGEAWIECTHTDLGNNYWTSY